MINLELGNRISAHLKIFIIRDSDNKHKQNSNIAESRSERLCEDRRDDIYTARSMDVYIVRLRKMIANSQSLCIENLYGSGHRITRCKNHEENDARPEKQESLIP